ncbi:MAG: STAS domain-containing protein [Planctomycetota bacterium]
MMGLTIRTAIFDGGLACISLDGDLDGRTSAALEKVVLDVLELGPVRLAFDLERLVLMTSAGAGVFVGALVMAQEQGGALALVRPAPCVQQVIDVLGLGAILPVADSLTAAAARIESLCGRSRREVAGTA